jgi:DNA-binding NarL/FixJ family response regulator
MLPERDRRIRILMIDDHAMLRTGLRMIIERNTGMLVVGEADNRRQALAAITKETPDIILLDLDLGDENGLDLLPDLLAAVPDAPIILLTGLQDANVQHRAMLMGATGVVLKQKAAETIIRAIERVHAGEIWIDHAMIASILGQRVDTNAMPEQNVEAMRIAMLTEPEHEVIRLICEGIQNRQIAERMSISQASMRYHLASIFAKLGVTDRFELAIYAFQHGIAKLPQ